jgi:hypothetical protein
MKPIERRVAALESGVQIRLPHHLPIEAWTDDQLAALATGRAARAATVTDAELIEIAGGRA